MKIFWNLTLFYIKKDKNMIKSKITPEFYIILYYSREEKYKLCEPKWEVYTKYANFTFTYIPKSWIILKGYIRICN